jgi:hypothetical protein
MRIYNNTGQLIELHTSQGVKILSAYGTIDAGEEAGSSPQVRHLAATDKIRLESGETEGTAEHDAEERSRTDDEPPATEPVGRAARKRSVPPRHK